MSSIIDPSLAKSLIKEYQSQNSAASGPALVTNNGQFLNGYFIDRQSLETVLNNSNFAGLSVYLAKHPDFVGAAQNVFTIVFAGAEPNPKWVEGSTTQAQYVNTGDAYEYSNICPPVCGSLGI